MVQAETPPHWNDPGAGSNQVMRCRPRERRRNESTDGAITGYGAGATGNWRRPMDRYGEAVDSLSGRRSDGS